MTWSKLYETAKSVLNGRKLSEFVEAGGTAAAVEAASGKIYVGVCVDAACSLGVCAERNAIFNMITSGEYEIRRVLVINSSMRTVPPCGACRELMIQVMPDTYKSIQVMLDYEKNKVATLGELAPEWWL